MPSLSFQKRFAPAIISGEKTQTIRAQRKRPIKVGDKLYLVTGMRTASCKKIKEAVCTSTRYVNIYRDRVIYADGQEVHALDLFAQSDGFEDFRAMIVWFEKNHELPFYGQIIRWQE
jgi:hypothetical protein